MKMKKYTAPSMPEAMTKIRKELGKDAVILQTKEIASGGIFGLFKKKQIEVIAGLDPENMRKPEKTIKPAAAPSIKKTVQQMQPAADRSDDQKNQKELHNLAQELKQALSGHKRMYSSPYQELYEKLLENEIDANAAAEIVERALQDRNKEAAAALQESLLNHFQHHHGTPIVYDKKFVHLVGPTGVGKTTTIAKLAAKAALNDQKSVAFITTDTYRIAAIDQLKTYAKILSAPLEVAYSAEDYQQAREKFADYDVVFVDTAGRNFKDSTFVTELAETLDLEQNAETFLTLSLATRTADLMEICQQFSALPIRQLIFTKLDEASKNGALVTIPKQFDAAISYLTHGQDVPDDMIMPNPASLAKRVMEASGIE